MIVPYVAIRNVLVQKDLGEKRAHWMVALQEYDLEINPAKIVIQQGLCLPAAQSNDPEQEQQWIQEEDMSIDNLTLLTLFLLHHPNGMMILTFILFTGMPLQPSTLSVGH